MNGTPTFDRISEATLERHRLIHFFLERLERTVEQLDETGADGEPLSRLPAMIDSLVDRLDEHNRDEDEGGLLQAVVDQVPEAEDDVLALIEQHGRFEEALRDARSRAASATHESVAGLRADLLELLRKMREHERAEETWIERVLALDARPSD